MKLLVALLVLAPLVSAASVQERGILDILGLGSFDIHFLKQLLANITTEMGSDDTEQNCEKVCHNILGGQGEAGLAHTFCHPICSSLQTLIHLIPIHNGEAGIQKRNFITDFLGLPHGVDIQFLKNLLANITSAVGSDASEQQCESACHNFLSGDGSGLAHTLCTPVCKSLQTLIHLIPIHNGEAAIQKRSILDFLGIHGLNLEELKNILTGILSEVGSDASEQQCETACHNLIALDSGNLLHTVCTPICRSLQTLIHLIPIHNDEAAIQKRNILDFLGIPHILNIQQLKNIINGILSEVGSDANEQKCETACHNVIALDESNLLHTVCTPICRSFQTIVHLIPHSKRSLGDFLGMNPFNLDQIKTIVEQIAQRIGSDANEQKCEETCQVVMLVEQSHLLRTLCTPICRSFQTLLQLVHFHHPSTTPSAHVRAEDIEAYLSKRGITDFFNVEQIKTIVEQIAQRIGSDASEQQCETTCHTLLHVAPVHLLHTFCTPICRSFQTLLQLIHFHHESTTPSAQIRDMPDETEADISKRFLFDWMNNFNSPVDVHFLINLVQQILDKIGSDTSEQKCEEVCHTALTVNQSHLLHSFCTPVCRSFQTLVNGFGLRPHAETTLAPGSGTTSN